MRCRTAQTWIVAARDGELGARQRRALDRHLGQCAQCRTERVSIEGVLAALDDLAAPPDVPARLEADVLRQVRGLAAERGADAAFGVGPWFRRLAPALTATAVVALAVIGMRSGDVTPPRPVACAAAAPPIAKAAPPAAERTAVARRPKVRAPVEPPAELASRPDLFVDLPILRDLDKLQHFDAIATMEEGDPTAPDDAPEPSNG